MSFLKEIELKKQKLRATTTTITHIDGSSYMENTDMRNDGADPHKLEVPKKHGFVVDLKPDNIPAEIIPGLLIGSQDCTEINILKSYNITHVLSLGIDITVSYTKNKYIPSLDLPETDIHTILQETNCFIQNVLDNNGRVLVHCNAGVSRSSMVVIGYLIMEKRHSFNDAYNLVKLKRPCIQPNSGFVKQLNELSSHLR